MCSRAGETCFASVCFLFWRRCPAGGGERCGNWSDAALPWWARSALERRARFWGFLAMFFEGGLFVWSRKGGRRALGVGWILAMDTGRELWAAGLRRALPAPAQGIYPLRIPFAAARLTGRCIFLSSKQDSLPAGLRRTPPAPAQGIYPLRIPFAAARSTGRCIPPVPNAAGGRPLLVGRTPSIPASIPTGTKQSAHAPYSWGMGTSTRSRRRWPAAPPPYSET